MRAVQFGFMDFVHGRWFSQLLKAIGGKSPPNKFYGARLSQVCRHIAFSLCSLVGLRLSTHNSGFFCVIGCACELKLQFKSSSGNYFRRICHSIRIGNKKALLDWGAWRLGI
jgi:hypothetical protein